MLWFTTYQCISQASPTKEQIKYKIYIKHWGNTSKIYKKMPRDSPVYTITDDDAVFWTLLWREFSGFHPIYDSWWTQLFPESIWSKIIFWTNMIDLIAGLSLMDVSFLYSTWWGREFSVLNLMGPWGFCTLLDGGVSFLASTWWTRWCGPLPPSGSPVLHPCPSPLCHRIGLNVKFTWKTKQFSNYLCKKIALTHWKRSFFVKN
jgi:hypothetical protein